MDGFFFVFWNWVDAGLAIYPRGVVRIQMWLCVLAQAFAVHKYSTFSCPMEFRHFFSILFHMPMPIQTMIPLNCDHRLIRHVLHNASAGIQHIQLATYTERNYKLPVA
uniref:Uncharacterized protein n=1 Tax=Arundo donax TaxID=35708 RepID=A0A0A9CMS1_ARUDO